MMTRVSKPHNSFAVYEAVINDNMALQILKITTACYRTVFVTLTVSILLEKEYEVDNFYMWLTRVR